MLLFLFGFSDGGRGDPFRFHKNMREMRAVKETAVLGNFRDRTIGGFQHFHRLFDADFRQILLWGAFT